MRADRRPPFQRRGALALVLAVSLHSALLTTLYWQAETAPLPATEAAPAVRLTVQLRPTPAPATTPPTADPPRVSPAVEPDRPPRLPRRPPATRPDAPSAQHEPGEAEQLAVQPAAPGVESPAAPGDDVAGGQAAELPPPDAAPFPRHAWGKPPADPAAPSRPALLPPGDDRAELKLPRRHRPGPLLSRVMTGDQAAPLAGDRVLAELLTPPPEGGEAAEQELAERLSARTTPGDGLSGRRVFARTERGGYRWVDENTGQPPPAPPAPRTAGLTRSSGHGFTFEDDPIGQPAARDLDDLRPTDEGGYVYEASGWAARIRPNGDVEFSENLASFSWGDTAPLFEQWNDDLGVDSFKDRTRGTADATDALMRLAGLDPYVAAKQCFLDESEPIRDSLRDAWRARHLEEAVAALRSRLDELWRSSSSTPVQKRRAVFELFDDCNAERAGQVGRDIILSWVRSRLPPGSPDAFTLEELRQFERERTGSAPFSPYGGYTEDGGMSGG